jgi:hypothetical protein
MQDAAASRRRFRGSRWSQEMQSLEPSTRLRHGETARTAQDSTCGGRQSGVKPSPAASRARARAHRPRQASQPGHDPAERHLLQGRLDGGLRPEPDPGRGPLGFSGGGYPPPGPPSQSQGPLGPLSELQGARLARVDGAACVPPPGERAPGAFRGVTLPLEPPSPSHAAPTGVHRLLEGGVAGLVVPGAASQSLGAYGR